jgi:hypothetical protein
VEKRVIEINGVKMEVDLRNAKTVNSYKVGDTIKVLKKNYSGSYDVHFGVIIGFTEFTELPTIEILYLKDNYSSADIDFLCYNAETEDVEIAPVHPYETLFSEASIVEKLDKQISNKEEELRTLRAKKAAFLQHFGKDVE